MDILIITALCAARKVGLCARLATYNEVALALYSELLYKSYFGTEVFLIVWDIPYNLTRINHQWHVFELCIMCFRGESFVCSRVHMIFYIEILELPPGFFDYLRSTAVFLNEVDTFLLSDILHESGEHAKYEYFKTFVNVRSCQRTAFVRLRIIDDLAEYSPLYFVFF